MLNLANLTGGTEAAWTSNCGGFDYSIYGGIEIKAKASVNTTAIVRLGQYNKTILNLSPNFQTFWLPWSFFALDGKAVNYLSIGEFSPSSATLTLAQISFGNSTSANKISDSDLITDAPACIENKLEIYPNPIQNSFVMKLCLKKESLVSIAFFSMNGNMVMSALSVLLPSGENIQNIDTSNIEAGMYYMRVSTIDSIILKKVFKLN